MAEYDIDWAEILRMAMLRCTSMEISYVTQIPHSYLTSRPEFIELYKKGWEMGKASLRRMQWECAERQLANGKATMLIFLGKNWLGQQDVPKPERNQLEAEYGVSVKEEQNLNGLTVQELEQLKMLMEKATVGSGKTDHVN